MEILSRNLVKPAGGDDSALRWNTIAFGYDSSCVERDSKGFVHHKATNSR